MSDNAIDDPSFQLNDEEDNTVMFPELEQEDNEQCSGDERNNSIVSVNTSATCNDDELVVSVSKATGGGDKVNVCIFCNKKQKKIARHLESVHKNEPDVKKFRDLPKGSKERTEIISLLRKQGNFNYNTKCRLNDGQLIVSRRPSAEKQRCAKNFLPCFKCKAYFAKSSLRVHVRKCSGIMSQKSRQVTILGKKVSGRLHEKASRVVREKLFPPLREDDIIRLIRYDELCIIYANKMCEKYRNERHFDMIRARLRLIGRFLQTMKNSKPEITDLKSVVDPKYCYETIKSINELAGANRSGHFETPTVASTLGTLLKYLAKILINESIINHDDVSRKNAKHFLALLIQEIEINITRAVTESQVSMRRRKTVQLPSTSDVKKLCIYLYRKRENAFVKLKKQFDLYTFLELSEVTLLSIQVFNRRRPGELERILITDFKSYEGITDDTEGITHMSGESKLMAKKYVRFLIRGKLNRTVPVILDKKQVQCIELILANRRNANIERTNEYVFAVPGKRNMPYLRACLLMRKHAPLCGAEYPERLRGTRLRKHIATTCIRLNLEDEQVKDLANFMGHHESIHKNIYRQSIPAQDILRVSKYLELAQGQDDVSSGTSEDEDTEIKKRTPQMLKTPNLTNKKRSSKI